MKRLIAVAVLAAACGVEQEPDVCTQHETEATISASGKTLALDFGGGAGAAYGSSSVGIIAGDTGSVVSLLSLANGEQVHIEIPPGSRVLVTRVSR